MTKAIIKHQFEEHSISQRSGDGYVNLTQLCKAGGKLVGHYMELTETKELLSALALDIGMTITSNSKGSGSLVETLQGGNKAQGTWAHPEVAIDCAQWVSMKLRIWANRTLMKIFSNQPIEAPPEDLWVPEIEAPQSPPHDALFEELAARVARMNQNPELEQRMQAIESHLFRTQAALAPVVPEISPHNLARKLVDQEAARTKMQHQYVWRQAYDELKYIHNYDVSKKRCKGTKLAQIEADGQLDNLIAIMQKLWQTQST